MAQPNKNGQKVNRLAYGNAPAVMMKQVTERPVPPEERRGDVPEDLNRIVMKLLAKSPSERFFDGKALIAALDGEPVSEAQAWRRYSLPPEHHDTLRRRLETLPPMARNIVVPLVQQQLDYRDAFLSRREMRRSQREMYRSDRIDLLTGKKRTLAERVRRFHGKIISYTGTSGFLFLINLLSNNHNPHKMWWFLFPVAGLGLGLATQAARLIGDGATAKQLFFGGKVPEEPPELPAPVVSASQPRTSSDDIRIGPYGTVLTQAMSDRQTVSDLLARLTETERKMLPEMKETADALFQRVVSLASALTKLGTEVDPARLKSIDDRIARIEQEVTEPTERARRLNLLKRQREMLAELVTRRAALVEQYESAGLLLQNMALDLLKVRSSGLDSAINGLTSATQEARALSKEIGYVLAANDEMRKLAD
jgi:hypothetical protein